MRVLVHKPVNLSLDAQNPCENAECSSWHLYSRHFPREMGEKTEKAPSKEGDWELCSDLHVNTVSCMCPHSHTHHTHKTHESQRGIVYVFIVLVCVGRTFPGHRTTSGVSPHLHLV